MEEGGVVQRCRRMAARFGLAAATALPLACGFAAASDPPIVVVPPSEEERNETGEYTYVEELPEAIKKVQPELPADAPEAMAGTVIVQDLVGKDGRSRTPGS
jgi:hypothetical protein